MFHSISRESGAARRGPEARGARRSAPLIRQLRALAACAVSWMCAAPGFADVVIDGRLTGTPDASLVGPDFEIPAELGVLTGETLVHALRELGIDAGESATFQAPIDGAPVSDVVTTVTGPLPSNIDGPLRSQMPGARFYLVNPNGIVFGPDAELDVGGAFIATTADFLADSAGTILLSGDPSGAGSSLAIAHPSTFGFFGAPAPIRSLGAQLEGAVEAPLAFVGGDIEIIGERGDGQPGSISSLGGRIDLASVRSEGRVIRVGGESSDLVVEADARGRIEIRDATVSSSGIPTSERFLDCLEGCEQGRGAGDVFVRSADLVLDDGRIRAVTVSFSDAGNVDIDLTQDLVATGVGSAIRAGGGLIVSGDLELSSGNRVSVFVPIQGEPLPNYQIVIESDDPRVFGIDESGQPVIELEACAVAECRISFVGFRLGANVLSPGAAGEVTITARDVRLLQGAVISAESYFGSPAGAISIVADGVLQVEGPVDGSIVEGEEVRGGVFSGGGQESAAGAISIVASEVDVGAFGGLVTESTDATGGGGSITVRADRVRLRDNGRIDTSTRGTDSAGRIDVRARERIDLAGFLGDDEFAGITSLSQPEATGSAGDIRVDAPIIMLSDGAAISTRSLIGPNGEAGNAGDIDLRFSDTLALDSSAITATADQAFGGNIYINGGPLTIAPDGGLEVEKPDDLESTGRVLYLRGSEISTRVGEGVGEGGDISIDPEVVVLDDSRIVANAVQSNAGNIKIVAGQIVADAASVVEASSVLAADGIVEIESGARIIVQQVAPLPAAFLDPISLMSERCAARQGGERVGSFVVRRRDGLPPSPDEYLSAPLPLAAFDQKSRLPAPETLRPREAGAGPRARAASGVRSHVSCGRGTSSWSSVQGRFDAR